MLDQYFDFKNKESEIYKKWEDADCFNIDKAPNPDGEVFNITMPPPNANGEMHIGHCYGHTIMDIMGRYHRLKGDRVLLVPGKDHAGIQTQVVYERKLRDEGVEIEKMPRNEFFKSCYDFCIDRSSYMRGQEKEIGTSADFNREIFTLEPGVSDIVFDTFFRMWKDGLVYRGSRIVHWSVYSQTSISDVEVEYKEQKGHFWHIKYPLVEAEAAPERKRVLIDKFGDAPLLQNEGNHWVMMISASDFSEKLDDLLKIGEVLVDKVTEDDVAIEREYIVWRMHTLPGADTKLEDLEKYDQSVRDKLLEFKGDVILIDVVPALDNEKEIVVATTRPETMLGDAAIAVHPSDQRYLHLVGKKVVVPVINRKIEIIADERVELSFGTGAVKITPAHDFLDYEIGNDHKLEQIQVIDKFGKMTEAAGEAYLGMSVEACRARLIEDLEKVGVLLLTEEITHKVPIAERGKDVIEPLISTQWYVNVDKEGLSLKKRALELVNSGRLKVYPARLKDQIVQWLENLTDWNISRQILWGHRMPIWYRQKDTSNEEIYVGKEAPEGDGWEQETDTFDTWFSSGQWPYTTLSSLGFLDLENPSKSEHFPTHTMLMGRDILLFWACRMLIFSAYRFNDVPWKNMYFTGLIRDEKGQKMSKSKGNGVEPKEMLDKYGADPLRAGLVIGSTAGQDVRFNEKKVDSYAKFLNKMWNAAKLVALKGEGDYQLKLPDYSDLKLDSSRWVLGQLREVQELYRQKMDNNEFSPALELIYHFSWDYFCSWYLEIAKIELETASEFTEEIKAVMFTAFNGVLQMIHPFMPFFTEEINENMERFGSEKLLAEQQFVSVPGFDENVYQKAQKEIRKVIDVVSASREFRKALSKTYKDQLHVSPDFSMAAGMIQLAQKLAGIELIDLGDKTTVVKPYPSGSVMIEASADEKKAFRESLESSLKKRQEEVMNLEKMLTPGFKKKADPELVADRVAQFEQIKEEVATLENELSQN
jgi:valyl-tRNA synthetase